MNEIFKVSCRNMKYHRDGENEVFHIRDLHKLLLESLALSATFYKRSFELSREMYLKRLREKIFIPHVYPDAVLSIFVLEIYR